MTNYEGFRLRNQQQVVYSVPSAAMRKGDFSQISTQIVDPANNRAPFASNIIPTNRLDPIAIKLLEFYPEPNIPGAGLSNNYLALQNHTSDKDQFTGRVDFVESQKSFWFGRYSWTDEFVRDPALKDNGQTTATNVKQDVRNFGRRKARRLCQKLILARGDLLEVVVPCRIGNYRPLETRRRTAKRHFGVGYYSMTRIENSAMNVAALKGLTH